MVNYSKQMAQKSDIKQIAELISRYLGTMDFIPAEKKASFAEIVALNEKSVARIIDTMVVARTKDNKVIGVAGIESNMVGDAYGIGLSSYQEIVGLAVDVKYRGQGIAKELLSLLLQKANQDVVFEAWGDTGRDANAHKALVANGFVRIKRLKDFYKKRGDCFLCVYRDKCHEQLCTCDIYLKKFSV